jgi:hypothetical protein
LTVHRIFICIHEHLKFLLWALTNERDFPVPSEPRTVRLAVNGN